MYTYLLQDWITASADLRTGEVIQSEADWIALRGFRDIVFWLDVTSVVVDPATAFSLVYETSPQKDPATFTVMASVDLAAGLPGSPTITPVLLSANPSVPLAQWIRWRLVSVIGANDPSTACFRIHCAANAVAVTR